jgi:hypothetical protein
LCPDDFSDWPVLADLIAFVDTLDLAPLHQDYLGFGSDAWPCDRLLVLALFCLHDGRPSPADWHRQARSHLTLRQLLDNRVPARSTLYAFRDRLALPLQNLNQAWLLQQRQHRPTLGQHLGIDGSFFALQASRHTLLSERGLQRRLHSLALSQWLEGLALALQESAAPVLAALLFLVVNGYCRHHGIGCPPLTPAWRARTPRGRVRQERRYRHALEVLGRRPRSAYAQRRCRKEQAPRISPSAPQALLGRDKQHVYRPLVNAQVAVDLDSGLITALQLVEQVNDANLLASVSQASVKACGVKPRLASVDSGYVQLTQLRWAAECGLEVYSRFEETSGVATESKGKFTVQDFHWQERQRVYRCPQGQLLRYRRRSSATRAGGERIALELYQADGAVCVECPQAGRCTSNPTQGRVIKRPVEEELRQACLARSSSARGEVLWRARKEEVERVFADWREHRGQGRICGRSDAATQAQLGLAQLYFNGRSTFTRSVKR